MELVYSEPFVQLSLSPESHLIQSHETIYSQHLGLEKAPLHVIDEALL